MKCLRCGRETEGEQIFCDHCLESMEAYPVKPGTAIQLPRRAAEPSVKKNRKHRKKRKLSPEEKLQRSQKVIRRMTISIVVLALALTASIVMLIREISIADVRNMIGKNYTIQSSESTTAEP